MPNLIGVRYSFEIFESKVEKTRQWVNGKTLHHRRMNRINNLQVNLPESTSLQFFFDPKAQGTHSGPWDNHPAHPLPSP